MTAPLLAVEGLQTHFRSSRGPVRAVDDVWFELDRGRTLAIVGESGSGKTALTRAIMGLHPAPSVAHAAGRVLLDGDDLRTLDAVRLRRVWGRRIGLVSQDPMVALNPFVRVGRQMTETVERNLGVPRREARRRAIELLEAVEISDAERRLRQYPHQLSGGLRQRITIAIAISCRPDLLIADEPTTALDVTVQAQIVALLRRLQAEQGMAMIFVSHDLGLVAGLADEIAVMYAGRIVEQAPVRQLFRAPRMRYSEALLASIPRIGQAAGRLQTIEGRPPDMVRPPTGCRFHPRCAHAADDCRADAPPLTGDAGHRAACWHPVPTAVDVTTPPVGELGAEEVLEHGR